MALLVKVNGDVSEITPPDGEVEFPLETLQNAVGGYVEILHLGSISLPGKLPQLMFMVVNEEGKLRQLPVNNTASTLAQLKNDYVVGNVVIANADEIGYEEE
jgi:hypothetical protein